VICVLLNFLCSYYILAGQASEHLESFRDHEQELLGWLFDRHADSAVGTLCGCPNPAATKTTRCYDCGYGPTCSECFIKAHQSSPTHWAEVWDADKGFFIRHDISALRSGYCISLGHSGLPCPSSLAEDPGVFFHIVDTNGVHCTRIRFCCCSGDGSNRAEQLMKARLFPATMRRPTMAFTWHVCHLFHILHLESKISTHDFIGSLRRLTDNTFAQDVPVSFLLCIVCRHAHDCRIHLLSSGLSCESGASS